MRISQDIKNMNSANSFYDYGLQIKDNYKQYKSIDIVNNIQ